MYTRPWNPIEDKHHDVLIRRDEDGAYIPFDEGNTDYQAYKAWQLEGGEAKDEEPPPPPPPPPLPAISRRQFFQALAMNDLISPDEALAALQHGAIPKDMEDVINNISDPQSQFAARMLLAGAAEFERNHPLVDAFAASIEMTPEETDDFWRQAATL